MKPINKRKSKKKHKLSNENDVGFDSKKYQYMLIYCAMILKQRLHGILVLNASRNIIMLEIISLIMQTKTLKHQKSHTTLQTKLKKDQSTRTDSFDISGSNYGNIDSFNTSDSSISDHVESIISQAPSLANPNLEPSRARSDNTYRNWMYKIAPKTGCSPNSKLEFMKVNYNHLPEENQVAFQNYLIEKRNKDNTLDVCQKVADNYKEKNTTKTTNDYYKVVSAMSPLLENAKKVMCVKF